MSSVGEVARAVAEFFGFVNKRTDLKNAPDVKEAAQKQAEADAAAAETRAVEQRNIDKIRENISE